MADSQDLRSSERYVIGERIMGSFGAAEIQVLNVSDQGAQISHTQPLRIATRARLSFKRGTVAVSVQGLVVWSRASKKPTEEGKLLYLSGLRIEEGASTFANAIHGLAEQGVIRRDVESLDKKKKLQEERDQAKTAIPSMRRVATQDIAPDTTLLVEHARERLRANPDEAQKWFSRAYFAVQQGEVPFPLDHTPHREDILAVWEYLERSVPLPVILKVFERKG